MRLYNRQIKSLKKSIKKWEAIVTGKATDQGSENCECCIIYTDKGNPGDCKSCPIKKKSGYSDCANTPWTEWRDYQADYEYFWYHNGGTKVFDKKSKRLAQAELNFLKSILAASTLGA